MTDTVIRVENLGKRYVLGQGSDSARYKTLRETLSDALGSHFARQAPAAAAPADEFWALQDVSFEIQRSDVVGVIGRNGAGKSTLLKILSRITEPTTGRISLKGRVASLLEVGTGFHPELTGRENVYLNGAILGMSRAEIKAKFDEIVAFAEVERFLDTPVKRYSSGMYVRLAFAVAAHLEPEILIVDEVLAVGDGEFQKKCLGKMESVSKGEGRTVIFVSHQMEAVRSLCKRCVYLHGGRVQAIGGSAETVQLYLDAQRQTRTKSWTRRQVDPGKPVSISGFYVLNDTGGTRVATGDDCRFVLEVEGRASFPRLRAAIGVDDKFGRRLFTLDSSKYYFSFDATPGVNRFVCRVRGLPLKPDVYRVHLYLGSDYEAYDYIDGDAELIVEAANFYPNPQVEEGHGSVFLAQEWMTDEKPAAMDTALASL